MSDSSPLAPAPVLIAVVGHESTRIVIAKPGPFGHLSMIFSQNRFTLFGIML
jgi:hypothetical protein